MINEKRILEQTAQLKNSQFADRRFIDGVSAVETLIKTAPEIVRCKDCMYCEDILGWHCFHPRQEYGWNSQGGEYLNVKPDDYCSYGHRK